MVVIKELGYLICVAMVLMVYLKQLLPRGKNATIVNGIISVFVLLSIVSMIRDKDWKKWELKNDSVIEIESIEATVADGLKEECNRFLQEQKINAEVIELEVEQGDGFEMVYLKISGEDGERAKQLLSARYQINLEDIEVKDER